MKVLRLWVGLWLVASTALATDQLPNNVAILDFTSDARTAADGADWAAGLPDFLEMALQKQDIPVLERRQIRLVLGERDLQRGGRLAPGTLASAKLPNVQYFIDGNVSQLPGNRFVLTLSIVRADSSTVENSFTRRGDYPTDWLPAIESLAKEVGTNLHIARNEHVKRSEFEMVTWLPEAALPFFKGLEYYSRGDYAGAVPWFRHGYEKDQHFDLARRWEARAYSKLQLPRLAAAVAGSQKADTRAAASRPVTVVVTSAKISAAARAAFVQALAQSGQVEIFDPASIGATAREMDLQLTGQMAAPLDAQSVWLVVDDLIVLDVSRNDLLVAREQNLLSGNVRRQAQVAGSGADQKNCRTLAKALLESKAMTEDPLATQNSDAALSEPYRNDEPEVAMAKALRLVQAAPDDARRWVGLADYYGDYDLKRRVLDEAVNAIERHREQPDAAFWLASALWRKREMSKHTFYEPTANWRATNPLTNDFSKLLEWFPQSVEAHSLVEVTNHGEGSYTYVTLKDPRYLGPVFTNTAPAKPQPVVESVEPVVTDAQRMARLIECVRDSQMAPAWKIANSLRGDGRSSSPQLETIYSNLLQTVSFEDSAFGEFTTAVAAKQSLHALELGRRLLNCIQRRQRADVIRNCGKILEEQKGVTARLEFVFDQAKRYRDDFLYDPITGGPADTVEYQIVAGTTLVMRVTGGPDQEYERLIGEVAEAAHTLPASESTRKIFEGISNDRILPLPKRLTAAYDLAMVEHDEGNDFEALELLKDILRQSEGAGLPLVRSDHWSTSVDAAAFSALRKIRIYSGGSGEICSCCGSIGDEPLVKPQNFDEMNALLGQYWQQQIGVISNTQPLAAQLLAHKDELLPTVLYKLQTGQEVSHMLAFCGDLGTNALPALPIITRIICRGEPFQDYNNALYAIGAIGRPAACVKPLLILARENGDNGNFGYALKRIGPAPKRVMPLLAQLLYHKNPEICKLAANAVIETAGLNRNELKNASDQQRLAEVRSWWEKEGTSQHWVD